RAQRDRRPGPPPAATNSCVGDRPPLHLQQIYSKTSPSGCNICPARRPTGLPDRTLCEPPPSPGGFGESPLAIATSFVQWRSVPAAVTAWKFAIRIRQFQDRDNRNEICLASELP